MALYYTSDKLHFFSPLFSIPNVGVHFSNAHSIIQCNLCAGDSSVQFPRDVLPSIHLFPDRRRVADKKTSLYSKRLMQLFSFFFVFRCCVFTLLANTYSQAVHQHRRCSSTQLLFHPRDFRAHFCTRPMQLFFLLHSSSTRWWWNGYTVWFGRLCVVLIFYASALGRCCVGECEVEVHSVYVRIF